MQSWYPIRSFPKYLKERNELPTVTKEDVIDDGRFDSTARLYGDIPSPRAPPNTKWPTDDLSEEESNSGSSGDDVDHYTLEDIAMNPNLRHRQASLGECMENVHRRGELAAKGMSPAVINFLDIPMSGSTSFCTPVQ